MEQDIRATSLRDHGKSKRLENLLIFSKRGSRTLCTIHYIDWNQKKSLNLSSYKDLPKSPIKAEANTELNYLQKMLLKNDKELTPELLDSLRPSKKIRKGDTMEVIEDRKEPRSEGEIDPQEPMDEEKE